MKHLAFFFLIFLSLPVLAGRYGTGLFSSTALDGHDIVAYFKENKAVKGSEKFQVEHDGVTWQFKNEENKKTFIADKEKYLPQYGGYCAYAVAQGDTAGIDPQAFKIVGDRIYFNYNPDIQKKWEANQQGFIEDANRNWIKLARDN